MAKQVIREGQVNVVQCPKCGRYFVAQAAHLPEIVMLSIADSSETGATFEFYSFVMSLTIHWRGRYLKVTHKNPVGNDATSLYRLVATTRFVCSYWHKLKMLCDNIDHAKEALMQLFLKGWVTCKPKSARLPKFAKITVKHQIAGTPAYIDFTPKAFELHGAGAVLVASRLLYRGGFDLKVIKHKDTVILCTQTEVFGEKRPLKVVVTKSVWHELTEWQT